MGSVLNVNGTDALFFASIRTNCDNSGWNFVRFFMRCISFMHFFLHSFGVLSSKYSLHCFVFMQYGGDFYCVLMTVKVNQQLN